jgi:hypothetical protein
MPNFGINVLIFAKYTNHSSELTLQSLSLSLFLSLSLSLSLDTEACFYIV